MEQKNLIVAAGVLGVGIIFGAWVHGAQISNNRAGDAISVTGSVKKGVTADLAKWTANINMRSSLGNVKEGIAQSAAQTEKVKQFIASVGLEASAVKLPPVQTMPVYESKSQYGYSQELVGYNVAQEIKVESGDIEKVERLANEAKKLADQGIVFESQRTEYYYTKLAELRPELFAAATKDARERAEAIASGTGVRVGALRSARTGVVQVLAPNSLDISDYGSYDLSTKEKEVSATVNVSFALEK